MKNDNNSQAESLLEKDTKRAVIGGVIAGRGILLGLFVINIRSGRNSRVLLESMLPSVRTLCSGVMTASSTILVLMLTMLRLSSGNISQFKAAYFERTKQIAFLDTAVLIFAILLL